MQIGAHVKTGDPLAAAAETGADLVQIFVSDPQSWKTPKPRADADELKASGVPIYVHSPYLVNLASPNNKIRIPSRKILQECCDAAADLQARAVIVHGGHVTADDSVEAGVDRWVKALDQLTTTVPIFLENTAGGDHAMARHFDTIARLWDAIGDYPVARELAAYGFRWFPADDPGPLRAWLEHPDPALLDHNLEVARRHFSLDALRDRVAALLERWA